MKKLFITTILTMLFAFNLSAQLQKKTDFVIPNNPTHSVMTNDAGVTTTYYHYDTNLKVDTAYSIYESSLLYAYKIGHDTIGNQTSYLMYDANGNPEFKQNWSYSLYHDTYSNQELPGTYINLTNYYHHYTSGVIDTTTVKNASGIRQQYALFTWSNFSTRKINNMYVYNNSNKAVYRELHQYGNVMPGLTFHIIYNDEPIFNSSNVLIGWQGQRKTTHYIYDGNLIFTRYDVYDKWNTLQWIHQGDRFFTYDVLDRMTQDSTINYSEEVPEEVINTDVIDYFYSESNLRKSSPNMSGAVITDILEEEIGINFNMFPNPANNVVNLTDLSSNPKEIRFIDSKGQIVYIHSTSQSNVKIDFNLNPGLYFVQILEGNKIIESNTLVVE